MGVLLILAVVVLSHQALGGVLGQGIRTVDQQIVDVIYRWRSPMLTKAMLAITNLGAAHLLTGLILVLIPVAWRKHKKEVLAFALIFMLGVLIHTLLKGMIHRPRPAISPLIGASGHSFPSGHAMNAFVFFSAVAIFSFRFTKRKVLSLLVALLAVGLVILTGFSRVYLGIHYPSDVVAGYVIGAWWLAITLLIGKSAALADVPGAEKEKAPR